MIKYDKDVQLFLAEKSSASIALFDHLVLKFQKVGPIEIGAAKTMIGISNSRKRVAWVTQFGKSFIHVVFPFERPYEDNLCFQKIAQVPGDDKQFNHHLRMLSFDDINSEVMHYMKLAFDKG